MNKKLYIFMLFFIIPSLAFSMQVPTGEHEAAHAAYRASLDAKIAAEQNLVRIRRSKSQLAEYCFYRQCDLASFQRSYPDRNNEINQLINSFFNAQNRLRMIEMQEAVALDAFLNASREEKAKQAMILARVRSDLYPDGLPSRRHLA